MTNVFLTTNGHCFYCLIKLEAVETDSGGSEWSSVYPVQELCHYLKVDLRKLASESGHSGHLLVPAVVPEGTDHPRLEVALCQECASTNEDFTDLCQRLKEGAEEEEEEAEEIELEMAYCIKLIQRKLATEKTNYEIGDAESNELRLAMALRMEIEQKCSEKLNALLSNVNDGGATTDTEADVDLTETPQIEAIIKTEPPPDLDQDNHQDEAMELHEESGDNIFTGFNEDAKKHLRIINPSKSLPTDSIDAGKPKWDPSGRLYQCQRCPKQFRDSTAAQRHYQNVHLGILYECTLCSKQFPSQYQHLRHFRSVHRGVRFKCRVCSQMFSSVQYVRHHYQAVHSGQRFQCQFCSETFSSPQGRTRHLSRKRCRVKFGKRGTPAKAKSKPASFPLKTETGAEEKIEPGPSKSTPRKPNKANQAAAEEAAKNYPFLEVVTEDEDSTNNEGEEEPEPHAVFNPITGKFKCHLCTKEYFTKRNVRGHHKAVHLKLRYKCKPCGRIFINKQTCIIHHSEVHVETELPPTSWECLGCAKVFKQHSNVGRHQARTGCQGELQLQLQTNKVKRKSLKRPYACEVCGWMFVQPHDLDKHAEEVHSQKRDSKFKCDPCGVEFSTRWTRTRHMLRFHEKK